MGLPFRPGRCSDGRHRDTFPEDLRQGIRNASLEKHPTVSPPPTMIADWKSLRLGRFSFESSAEHPGDWPLDGHVEEVLRNSPCTHGIEDRNQESKWLVSWEGENDPQNPHCWSSTKRMRIVLTVGLLSLITPLSTTMFAPSIEKVVSEFAVKREELVTLAVTIEVLGFAVGSLFLAPLSEIFGRLPIYHLGNLFFILFTIACAVSTNISQLVVFRFLEGFAGSVPMVIGGSTMADMIPVGNRRAGIGAMGIWGMGPLMGPIIGPIGGGFLSEAKGWRWVFWTLAMMASGASLVALAKIRETYSPVLLQRKARRLRKETGEDKFRSAHDSKKFKQHFVLPIMRPIKLLLMSPTVLILSLHIAITYGYMYLLFTSIPIAFEEVYAFGESDIGLVFIGLGIGMSLGLLLCWLASKIFLTRRRGNNKSESGLLLMIPGALSTPVGLLLYGWAMKIRVHFLVPIVGTIFVGMGFLSTFLPIQSYLVEVFGMISASAMAANIVLRCLVGAFLPLSGNRLFQHLGQGWGSTLLAGISLATFPIPLLFGNMEKL